MFRKSKSKELVQPPIHLDDTPPDSVQRQIINTVEQLELDKNDHFIIVGSAALALYGIIPPAQWDEDHKPRPGDVDLAVTHALISALYKNRRTPSGVPVRRKEDHVHTRQTILQVDPHAIDPPHLPVDFITRFNPKIHRPDKYDAGFGKHFESNSHVVPGGNGIKVATLHHIRNELHSRKHLDPKARDDLSALDRHISSR